LEDLGLKNSKDSFGQQIELIAFLISKDNQPLQKITGLVNPSFPQEEF